MAAKVAMEIITAWLTDAVQAASTGCGWVSALVVGYWLLSALLPARKSKVKVVLTVKQLNLLQLVARMARLGQAKYEDDQTLRPGEVLPEYLKVIVKAKEALSCLELPDSLEVSGININDEEVQ
jgi:hypothetical protein